MGRNSCPSRDRCNFYAYFNSNTVKVETEYRLMDTAAMISATGGSLGLFLGFSVYGEVLEICNYVKKLLKKT